MGLTARLGAARGPSVLVLVRHAQSVGNVADARARDAGAEALELTGRDADVPLTADGERQAAALARAVAALTGPDRPELVLSSPFRRTADTARAAFAGTGTEVVLDERLREHDQGLLTWLTPAGVAARFPAEHERRTRLGTFSYTPPAGESFADVVARVRSLLADLREGFDGARVWMFTHQAVVMACRYLLEGLDETGLAELEARTTVPNASLTTYRRTGTGLELAGFADTSDLG